MMDVDKQQRIIGDSSWLEFSKLTLVTVACNLTACSQSQSTSSNLYLQKKEANKHKSKSLQETSSARIRQTGKRVVKKLVSQMKVDSGVKLANGSYY